MKIGNTILLSFVIILLVHCKKEKEGPYPDDYILRDHAMATVYFHTVFREAENAWATMHHQEYVATYSDPASSSTRYKNFTYDETTNSVTIEYNAWVSDGFPDLLLIGNMIVTFDKYVYGTANGATATVRLNGFSINGQMVAGESKIAYQKVENDENDHYNYTLLNGAAIHEKGNSMPVLISATISNGRYVRTAGVETLTQDDDVWTYSGTMTGRAGKDQSLTYTNTILNTYTDEDGETQDGTVCFRANCNFAQKGVAQIKIPGRPDITYLYHCLGVDYFTVTHIE